jgi:hypothetical protein
VSEVCAFGVTVNGVCPTVVWGIRRIDGFVRFTQAGPMNENCAANTLTTPRSMGTRSPAPSCTCSRSAPLLGGLLSLLGFVAAGCARRGARFIGCGDGVPDPQGSMQATAFAIAIAFGNDPDRGRSPAVTRKVTVSSPTGRSSHRIERNAGQLMLGTSAPSSYTVSTTVPPVEHRLNRLCAELGCLPHALRRLRAGRRTRDAEHWERQIGRSASISQDQQGRAG